MCVKNKTIIYVARASNSKRDCEHDLYCCLLPRCEALRTCRSGFPIATVNCLFAEFVSQLIRMFSSNNYQKQIHSSTTLSCSLYISSLVQWLAIWAKVKITLQYWVSLTYSTKNLKWESYLIDNSRVNASFMRWSRNFKFHVRNERLPCFHITSFEGYALKVHAQLWKQK